MWLLLLWLFLGASHARKCCSTCTCSNRCEAPRISASLNASGLIVHCPNADCACVVDELDTCTYGSQWHNVTEIEWQDPRWHKCIKLESYDPLRARALIRWWRNRCMGHVNLNLDIQLDTIFRDLYVDFNVVSFFDHATIHNVFRIRTVSGSADERPKAGSSEMYFEALLDGNNTGVHVEITNCTVQVIAGKDVGAPVINEYNVFAPSRLSPVDHGMRLSYTAFWDAETNSPFQRLLCKYELFNGTNNEFLTHNYVNRTYMIADPNENGILINDQDDIISDGL